MHRADVARRVPVEQILEVVEVINSLQSLDDGEFSPNIQRLIIRF
jgi:hypothetical protein